jgi:hypothetical protein
MWESLAIRQLGVLEMVGSNPTILTRLLPCSTMVVRLVVTQTGAGSNPAGAVKK